MKEVKHWKCDEKKDTEAQQVVVRVLSHQASVLLNEKS